MSWIEITQLTVGGINLALVLKLVLNDIHELRRMFFDHLRDHQKGS